MRTPVRSTSATTAVEKVAEISPWERRQLRDCTWSRYRLTMSYMNASTEFVLNLKQFFNFNVGYLLVVTLVPTL